jgi:hypothetical protein
MNNEPVAWIIDASMTDCDDNFIWNTGDYPDWQVKDWIPLYTHPAELTNEEKWKLWSECPNGLVYDRVMMFADLILRKANEK